MRLGMRPLRRYRVPALGQFFDCPPDASGNACCTLDEFLGLCTPVLTTATGTPLPNLNIPAPVPGTANNYSPDIQTGQMQGGTLQAQIDNSAVGAQAGGNTTAAMAPASQAAAACQGIQCVGTATWVLLAVAATLGLILTVKK
jgi:hypothetical protein